jgi:uncharacterized membrane protein YkvA (DUF1232 family)
VVQEALRLLPNLGRLMWGLARDRGVSYVDKALVVGAALYLVMPLDLVPDFLPFFGQVDDLVLLLVAVRRLVRRAGPEVVLRHWRGDPALLADGRLAQVVGLAARFLPGRRGRR